MWEGLFPDNALLLLYINYYYSSIIIIHKLLFYINYINRYHHESYSETFFGRLGEMETSCKHNTDTYLLSWYMSANSCQFIQPADVEH